MSDIVKKEETTLPVLMEQVEDKIAIKNFDHKCILEKSKHH